MLINRGIPNDELEMRERQFVEALSGGYATHEHFDNLADMANILFYAATKKQDAQILALLKAVVVAAQNIRLRHEATGKFGANGDELTLLRSFCGIYRDFWLRQPVTLYVWACDELTKDRTPE